MPTKQAQSILCAFLTLSAFAVMGLLLTPQQAAATPPPWCSDHCPCLVTVKPSADRKSVTITVQAKDAPPQHGTPPFILLRFYQSKNIDTSSGSPVIFTVADAKSLFANSQTFPNNYKYLGVQTSVTPCTINGTKCSEAKFSLSGASAPSLPKGFSNILILATAGDGHAALALYSTLSISVDATGQVGFPPQEGSMYGQGRGKNHRHHKWQEQHVKRQRRTGYHGGS